MRVLVISPDAASIPDWSAESGERIELIREGSLVGGETRLSAEQVDVVLVDTGVPGATDGGLEQLQRRAGGTPLLVLGEGGNGTSTLRAHAVDGVIPHPADPGAQWQLLRGAVERARLADQLERSEARFRDVIERNADAIVVVDRGGVVCFANAVAGELFATSRSELVGSPFGYPIAVGESTEVDIVRRDRPPAVVELRVVESEWDGEAACIISLRDITERKQAEEDARRLIRARAARSAAVVAARRFRFLAESTAVLSSSLDYQRTLAALARLCVAEIADWALIYIVDDEGAVHRLEVAHRDAAKLQLVRELRDTPIHPDFPHPVLTVLETGEPLLARRLDDRDLARVAQGPRHMELLRELGISSFMLVPLTARGRSLGAIGLVCADPDREFGDQDLALAEDLASRAALAVDNARLYQKAQDATRAKSDLLAVISHDLRTPLNSIIGYAELLIMGVPEPLSDGARERVERMRAGAQHLLHLINQLLTLSRLDAGREEVHLEDMDLVSLVREVGIVMEPLAQERHLSFRMDLPDTAVRLWADPGKLRQVLVNLTANAVKFTERGEVRIRVREPTDDAVEIHVADTGPGIAAEHLDHIFEPFWQVDAADRPADGGTGLGLSVVRRLVELMGGEIGVTSELGAGSTFTVTVPRRASSNQTPPADAG